jgi:hypothetical protein
MNYSPILCKYSLNYPLKEGEFRFIPKDELSKNFGTAPSRNIIQGNTGIILLLKMRGYVN